MIGLRHKQNLLIDYDPEWPSHFETEREPMQLVLGNMSKGIERHGSADLGLRAKPIIDILVGIPPLSDWVHCQRPLESLGYVFARHAGVPGHYIFSKNRDLNKRTHLVHIVEFDSLSWRFNLEFREALRQSRNLRERCLTAKKAAVKLAPEGRAKYNKLKQTFFDKVNLENGVKQRKSG